MSILIVEQKVKEVLNLAEKAIVLRLGKIVQGNAKEMAATGEYKKNFKS